MQNSYLAKIQNEYKILDHIEYNNYKILWGSYSSGCKIKESDLENLTDNIAALNLLEKNLKNYILENKIKD